VERSRFPSSTTSRMRSHSWCSRVRCRSASPNSQSVNSRS